MAAAFPTLWPDDIRVDAVPPLTILQYQADRIGPLTKGILEGHVTTTTGPDDYATHRLELVAPRLGRRYGVLNAIHRGDYYPVVLEADCYRPKRINPQELRQKATQALATKIAGPWAATDLPLPVWPHPDDWRPAAANQEDFVKRVGEVLRSMQVRAAIDTLIALSNEKAAERGKPADPAA